jgi:hypothetical protein
VQDAHLAVGGQLVQQVVAGQQMVQLARGVVVGAEVVTGGHGGLLGWRCVHPSNAVALAAVTARL